MMKIQLFTAMAVFSAMGASTAPELRGQKEMNLLAKAGRPFPSSDPHTVDHGARDLETSICSTALPVETQNPVSAAPEAESLVMTDCVSSAAPSAPSPCGTSPINPSQPSEGGAENSPVSPCPKAPEENGSASSAAPPEAGFGGGNSASPKPAPTESFSFPGEGQMAPTEPCDPIVSAPAPSGAANQTLTTIVLQPIEQIPATTESPAPPKETQTGPVQASTASPVWTVGAPTTFFVFELLRCWLAV